MNLIVSRRIAFFYFLWFSGPSTRPQSLVKIKTCAEVIQAVYAPADLLAVSPPAGCEQEKHHSGGVVGGHQGETVLHTHHDQERLGVVYMGLPED